MEGVCYRLVSHDEYVLRALLRLEKRMGQTYGRTTDRYITLTAKRVQCNEMTKHIPSGDMVMLANSPVFGRTIMTIGET